MKKIVEITVAIGLVMACGAYAATCLKPEMSETCPPDDYTVDTITFPNAANATLIKSDGTWNKTHYPNNQSVGVAGTWGVRRLRYCDGPAYFENPETAGMEFISWWVVGTKAGNPNHRFYRLDSDLGPCTGGT